MIYSLIDQDNLILHRRVLGVSSSCNREGLSRILQEAMIAHNGIGLAAPQIGIEERAFAIILDGQPVTCFNPEVGVFSKEKTVMTEGCLSFPDAAINVNRPSAVRVAYENELGTRVTVSLFGIEAKCFQHELDHLDGITMLDRGVPAATNLNTLDTGYDLC